MLSELNSTSKRSLINIYWVTCIAAYVDVLSGKIASSNGLSIFNIILSLFLILFFGIGIELVNYKSSTKTQCNRYIKYIATLSVAIILLSMVPIFHYTYMLPFYFLHFMVIVLFYNSGFLVFGAIIDVLLFILLYYTGDVYIHFETNASVFFLYAIGTLFLSFYVLYAYSRKTLKVIDAAKNEQAYILESNKKLQRLYEEISLKQRETEALNQQLAATNQSLEETNDLFNMKQQEIIALNIGLTESNQKLEESYEELNAQKQETEALNEELRALNENLEEVNNLFNIKQQETIALNIGLTESNEKLEDSYQELKAQKQETEALNEQLIALNDSLEEVNNLFNMKQQEIIALNLGLSESNEKLEEAYDNLNSKQEETEALNEELIASNESLSEAYDELRKVQIQMLQSEKMASLGQLSAGIAHEINNPMGAINCNLDLSKRVISMIEEDLSNSDTEKAVEKLKKLDGLNNISLMASERIVKIVKSLKTFARLDQDEYQEADINSDIENSLLILGNKFKNKVEVIRDYGEIPKMMCFASQLNQVYVNLLVNAVDSIAETGKVWIKTYVEDGNVCISIKDTGAGIKPEIIDKIFNPGFTTKGVGVGTGLGLAIVYSIVQKHDGKIDVNSKLGQGTEFVMKLPIKIQS